MTADVRTPCRLRTAEENAPEPISQTVGCIHGEENNSLKKDGLCNMPQTEGIQIQAEGMQNANLVLVSMLLGMLDMIEKGVLSVDDAAMLFFLPILLRTGEDDRIHRICSMTEEWETYPPGRRKDISEQIRSLCYELMGDYNRSETLQNGESIAYSFHS